MTNLKLKTLYAIAEYLSVEVLHKSSQLLFIGERFLTLAPCGRGEITSLSPALFTGRPTGSPLQEKEGVE